MNKNFHEEIIESRKIFEGKILSLRVDKVRLPSGKEATREVVEHFITAVVVPLTEKNEIILTRQFRLPTGKILLEVPAGRIENGEEPLTAAKRELLEETGYTAEKWEKKITAYTSPGFSNEMMHIFVARHLKKFQAQPDHDEFLEVVTLPLGEALKMIKNGEFEDSKTILSLLLVANEKLS